MLADYFSALIYAFGLLFITELGDKTQLIILTLASKGRSSKKLAIGASLGFAVIVILGGIIAILLSKNFKIIWITFISGLVFVLLGAIQIIALLKKANNCSSKDISKIKGEKQESEKQESANQEALESESMNNQELLGSEKKSKLLKREMNDYTIGFFAIVSMEIGDKTQLMTIILAAASPEPIAVLLGAWIALSLLAVIGAFAGVWLSKKVPKKAIDWFASLLFLIIGAVLCISVFV